MSSNRRLRRLEDRMMKKPKFVEALRRFNDLPTNKEMDLYIKNKTNGVSLQGETGTQTPTNTGTNTGEVDYFDNLDDYHNQN